MSFVEQLRNARSSPTAIIHEFRAGYDARNGQVHAFVEGHDDKSFYRSVLLRHAAERDVRTYACGRKRSVLEALLSITKQHGDTHRVMFFVDKDIDDLVGEPHPTDERLFVTDTYSIESYLACSTVLSRWYDDAFRITGATFDVATICRQFEHQLEEFHRQVRVLMAWALVLRRSGLRPVLNNVNLSHLFRVSDRLTLEARPQRTHLQAYLEHTCGVTTPPGSWRAVRHAVQELRALDPKRYVRGKFEAWFFIEYLRSLATQLDGVAKEVGGSCTVRTILHVENFVEVLSPRVAAPPLLDAFCRRHIHEGTNEAA